MGGIPTLRAKRSANTARDIPEDRLEIRSGSCLTAALEKDVKICTHFVGGQGALADDEVSRKIVRRVDTKDPFFSRYEMSDRLEALFNETCFANWQN